MRLSPGKKKPSAPQNPVLCVDCDVSHAHVPDNPDISLAPSAARVESVIADLVGQQESGTLLPAVAASLAGRLRFVLDSVMGRFGIAILSPLYDRAEERDDDVSAARLSPWTESLDKMLQMLLAFLAFGAARPRRLRLLRSAGGTHAVIYSDATGKGELGLVLLNNDGHGLFARCASLAPRSGRTPRPCWQGLLRPSPSCSFLLTCSLTAQLPRPEGTYVRSFMFIRFMPAAFWWGGGESHLLSHWKVSGCPTRARREQGSQLAL